MFAHESLKNDKEVGELGLAISDRIALFTVAMCKVVMEAVAEGGHIASAA